MNVPILPLNVRSGLGMEPRFGRLRWLATVTAVATAALVPATVGGSSEVIPGPVPAQVLEVIDGDTVVVRARIWIGQEVETRVRLQGVDAPELRGKCARERLLARQARDLVQATIGGGEVIMRDIRYGKYAGRVVARVLTPEGADSTDALLEAGLGRPYRGGRRESWCDGDDTP